MKTKSLLAMILTGLLAGCNSPETNRSFVAPGGGHWVAMEELPPKADEDRLLPTLRLSLKSRFDSAGPLILEGVETLCGTHVQWMDPHNLRLSIGADRAGHVKITQGQRWGKITLHLTLHHQQLKFDLWSPDGERRLLVIASCESEAWNVYLRRPEEPIYNEAMQRGWDDPDLFGGFEASQQPLALKWTSSRSAEIRVAGRRHEVTVREQVGDVSLKWVFVRNFSRPETEFRSLEPFGSVVR
jgi:hypothetical protein